MYVQIVNKKMFFGNQLVAVLGQKRRKTKTPKDKNADGRILIDFQKNIFLFTICTYIY